VFVGREHKGEVGGVGRDTLEVGQEAGATGTGGESGDGDFGAFYFEQF